LIVQLPDGRVIRLVDASQEIGMIFGMENFFYGAQYLRQRIRAIFRRSTRAGD